MEESKSDQSSRTQFTTTTPPNAAQDLFPQTTPTPPPQNDNKRKLSDGDIQNSSFSKICAIVHDLRPHFMEVLRTPDFRNCKAAHEIRKQMKLLMDLYKQMTVEAESVASLTNVTEPLSGESVLGKESRDGNEKERQAQLLRPKSVPEKSAEKMPPPCSSERKADDGRIQGSYAMGGSEKKPPPCSSGKKADDGQIQGSYVIGGSVFGWNFITFAGSKPVYYGVTKELYRSSHPNTEMVNVPTSSTAISNK